MWDVAIIGAGLSGVTCALDLKAAGQRVCILDKSRGLGGRMATRRASGLAVDHGLRYWQPASDGLKALTQEMLDAGVIKRWEAIAYELQQRDVMVPHTDELGPRYVADGGMSAIAKYLTRSFTADQNLMTGRKAVGLSYEGSGEKGHWKIERTGGERVLAKKCAIAIPAPQAADLLKTADNSAYADLSGAIDSLKSVTYFPCLTVLAGYHKHFHNLMGELDPKGWMITDLIGTSTDWIGLDSSKRDQADRPVVVIHSKPDFAQQYIDSGDLQPAASVLLRANARKYLDWIAQPEWFQIHRWRYAHVQSPYAASVLPIGDRLVCGGDWCVPSGETSEQLPAFRGIDHAYHAGLAMAKAIIKSKA